jgi:RNA polymerase sigma-70 factor (ECF subfamily)
LIKDAQREYVCLRNESFDDLLQECLIHWFFIKDQYRSEAGASERTFLNRITRNKLADLARFEGRNKRRVFSMSESLDAMDSDEKLIGKKERILMVEEQTISKITAADLPDAMARATAGLSFRQKLLCRYLSEGMSLVKAGEKMNIPRTTLQEEIKRIREVFRKEGLEEYLR